MEKLQLLQCQGCVVINVISMLTLWCRQLLYSKEHFHLRWCLNTKGCTCSDPRLCFRVSFKLFSPSISLFLLFLSYLQKSEECQRKKNKSEKKEKSKKQTNKQSESVVNMPRNVCLCVWVSSLVAQKKNKKLCVKVRTSLWRLETCSLLACISGTWPIPISMDLYTDGIYGIGSLCSIATVTWLKHYVSCVMPVLSIRGRAPVSFRTSDRSSAYRGETESQIWMACDVQACAVCSLSEDREIPDGWTTSGRCSLVAFQRTSM